MNGYGPHTYQWINAAGEPLWIKYHFHSQQGLQNLTNDEIAAITAGDADYHIRDLFEAIERGDFPKWLVSVEVMPHEEAKTYRINLFDLTKIWPHSDYPLISVGKFVLDSNPENYFAEIEQAAFEPSNLVPGIDVSPVKMLLARVFAYADSHRYPAQTITSFPSIALTMTCIATARTDTYGTISSPARSPCTRRIRLAAPRPTPCRQGRLGDGVLMAIWFARPTRSEQTTMTSGKPMCLFEMSTMTPSGLASCRHWLDSISSFDSKKFESGSSGTGTTSIPIRPRN